MLLLLGFTVDAPSWLVERLNEDAVGPVESSCDAVLAAPEVGTSLPDEAEEACANVPKEVAEPPALVVPELKGWILETPLGVPMDDVKGVA